MYNQIISNENKGVNMGELNKPDKIPHIRRGYDFKIKNTICHVSYKADYTFGRYGLNSFKNMLESVTFMATDTGRDDSKNRLNEMATTNLLSVIEAVECAAIFVVKLDGTKLIYQIDHDYYFDDEEESFVEDEPIISVTRIRHDIDDKAFSIFDAENNYELYGLLVEISPNAWMSVIE